MVKLPPLAEKNIAPWPGATKTGDELRGPMSATKISSKVTIERDATRRAVMALCLSSMNGYPYGACCSQTRRTLYEKVIVQVFWSLMSFATARMYGPLSGKEIGKLGWLLASRKSKIVLFKPPTPAAIASPPRSSR